MEKQSLNPEKPQPITFQKDIYWKVIPFISSPKEGLRVIDAGAGEGYMSRLLKDLGYDVTACDISASAFKCPDIPFIRADLNKGIPLEDNIFDYTISIEVIEHIENHGNFIKELIRITKPGGRIIITTPNITSLSSRLHFFIYGYPCCAPRPIPPDDPKYYMHHINPISLPELLFWVEKYGGILERLTTNRYRKGSYPLMLFYPFLSLCLKLKFLRKRYITERDLNTRHIDFMLSRENLMGRILIAIIRKPSDENPPD